MSGDAQKRRVQDYNYSSSTDSLEGPDSDEDCQNVDIAVTLQDNKTVDEALSLVDEYSDTNFGGKCPYPEDYTSGEGEEEESVIDILKYDEDAKDFTAVKYIRYLKPTKKTTNADGTLSPIPLELFKTTPNRKRKKKSIRHLSICTSNCKYAVVRRVARRFGMKDVSEGEDWNVYWTDLSVSIERVKEMKRFQKINHFPGMLEICRKDLLARNLNRMFKLFPKDYNFFPKTWCLPADFGDMLSYARNRRCRTYICKPDTGCQGRGIFITRNLKEVKPFERMICQVYISKPFLVDGFKFDLRLYVLITSCDPLRVYVYNEGLARFATCRYREPNQTNTSNVYMHLTNYAVNKHSRTYVVDDEAGSKRKISTLNKWLQNKQYNLKELWQNIDEVIVKTIIAAHPIVKHSYHACFPGRDYTYACFELLGFDILLDYKLKPYILEVNHSPSFHTDAPIDCEIKENLLMDTFEILNICNTDKKKIMEEDRKRVRERLLKGVFCKDSNNSANGSSPSEKQARQQKIWEEKHKGNFRIIYPCDGSEKYDSFFNQTQSSIFQETVASKAREEDLRQQRESFENKSKQEAAKRIGGKTKEADRPQPESPRNKEGNKPKPATVPPIVQPPPKKKPLAICLSIKKSDGNYILNSFEPGMIVDSEERERVSNMAQRDFLIRSCGITEQIYKALMKNGSLRPADEQRYGLYGKLGYINKMITASSKRLPIVGGLQNLKVMAQNKSRNILLDTQFDQDTTVTESLLHLPQTISVHPLEGLKVTCNNAPIFVRPQIPQSIYAEDNTKERDIRSTKTQLARCLTNIVKLQEIEKRVRNQQ